MSHAAEKPSSTPIDAWVLFSFAVAIPLLATSTIIFSTQARYADREYEPRFRLVILVLGTLLALIGFNLLFWRISAGIGIVFTLTSVVGFCFWASFQSTLKKKKSKKPESLGH